MAVSGVHPAAERLLQYADRALTPAERLDVERHLADCARCRQVLAGTVASMAAEEPDAVRPWDDDEPFRVPRWAIGVATGLATAALIVLAIRVVRPEWLPFGPRTDRPELRELIAAWANEPTRPVEARLSGGFAYAPPPSPIRGPGDRGLSPDVRIAAAKIEKLAREGSPSAIAALGVAYLSVGDIEKAIDALTAEANRSPSSATLSNLAAAHLAKSTAADDAKALDAAQRAVDLAGNCSECWFNLALAQERLGRAAAARVAWERCITLEHGSAWGDEAARHRDALPPAAGGSYSTRFPQALLAAVLVGGAAKTFA